MGIARIVGVALVIAAVATLCLVSMATATFVAIATVVAVGVDGLMRQPRREAREGAVLIDLSTRDFVEGIDR